MNVLNLGILAHVDAGKTSLTERLLFAAGAIDVIGSVDGGDTQTDTLALERERGITIKTAVASFVIGDVNVNLIDTPGHPDFIAEVDRVVRVLDGAVLVVSAVEGVQAQTRVLMRALRRLAVPTVVFVNKIDRMGADIDRVVAEIESRLCPDVRVVGVVVDAGTSQARVVCSEEGLAGAARGTTAGYVPVCFGSAITGAGIAELMNGITDWLPPPLRQLGGRAVAVVFKIERSPRGERIAIARMMSGVLRVRDRVAVRGDLRRVTNVAVFAPGGAINRSSSCAGEIAKISGLGGIRIGDVIGDIIDENVGDVVGENIGSAEQRGLHQFEPPPFEAVVAPVDDRDRAALWSALDVLADEDPLIGLRQDETRGELSVSLYGDVQRDVIRDTLLRDFGVRARFRDTTVLCIERIAGSGEAEVMMLGGRSTSAPFLAGVGVRVEPAPDGAGVIFSAGIELGKLPLAFVNAVAASARETMRQGLHGWEVPDCTITMTRSGYWPRQSHAHATFDKNMSSTANDFRLLTPLVLMEAVRRAGTIVHEQVLRFHLEAPIAALGPISRLLANVRATPNPPISSGQSFVMDGLVPAAHLRELRQMLPGLTRGEGFVEAVFDSYRQVLGPAPSRSRVGLDPLDRTNYLRQIAGRI